MAITVRDKEEIRKKLDEIYDEAWAIYTGKSENSWNLPAAVLYEIDDFSDLAEDATSGFTNLITCLTCKATDETIDCRYHRPPKKEMPEPPSGPNNYFSGRQISEHVISPWLQEKEFTNAKSGWQTRTFERPRPYTLDYYENIGHIKEPFLHILDSVQNKGFSAFEVLKKFFLNEIEKRDNQQIVISTPSKNDIFLIGNYLRQHFNYKYKTKGVSRLPVLAVYAIYIGLMNEVNRYKDKKLMPLAEHSAADARTHAIGDIEVVLENEEKFEGVEIKHDIRVDANIIYTAYYKFREHQIDRYYILTTSMPCVEDPDNCEKAIDWIRSSHGCQVIVNGVIPSIMYYLRLLNKPSNFYKYYAQLLKEDNGIRYEHRAKWNEIVIS
mgnify:CR=1 FL=1